MLRQDGRGRGFVRDVNLPVRQSKSSSAKLLADGQELSFIATVPDGEHFCVVTDTKQMHIVTVQGVHVKSYKVKAAPTSVVFQQKPTKDGHYRLIMSCWADKGEMRGCELQIVIIALPQYNLPCDSLRLS